MSGARHFVEAGTFTNDQLKNDIEHDIAATRGAQRDLTAVGQYAYADRMGEATDEHLDELNDLKNGKWSPRHA